MPQTSYPLNDLHNRKRNITGTASVSPVPGFDASSPFPTCDSCFGGRADHSPARADPGGGGATGPCPPPKTINLLCNTASGLVGLVSSNRLPPPPPKTAGWIRPCSPVIWSVCHGRGNIPFVRPSVLRCRKITTRCASAIYRLYGGNRSNDVVVTV